MQNSVFFGFLQNMAILLSFSLVYDYLWIRDEEIKKISGKILAGLLIGVITVLLMRIPWSPAPGVGFDARSIILSISGLFFGPLPTFIAMLLAMGHRISMGGDGMWMGLAIIISSGFIGMIWRMFFPPKKIKKPYFNILLLGLLVHLVMLASAVFLPKAIRLDTLKEIILPVLVLYVPGTLLIGLLMLKRWQIWQQHKLKEKEELRYRELFEASGEAILVAQEGYIIFANERLSDMLGRSYDEIRSKPFTEFIHPDDREMVLEHHEERVQHLDAPRSYSFRIVSNTGEVRWIEINSVYLEWDGEPSSLSFLTDVTSQRETSRQLVMAKNRAEESDRLKTIFLSNMSHEIRTPMNAILGFSDLMKTDRLSKSKREHYANMIQSAGSQLLNIINDIVDLSKLEVNQLNIINKPVMLNEIFTQSVEVLKNNPLFIEKEEIDLIVDLPQNIQDIRVNADPYRICQIIDNLLGNAVKYTEKGHVELSVSADISEDLVHLEVHVRDTGSGIPDHKKDIIFERFRQVEENNYREGAGLGLSIIKGLIELMGGKVGVKSIEGEGSDFFFSLDLLRNVKERDIMINQEKLIPDLKGIHVIVAEDDQTSFYLIKEYLSETNAKVEQAQDGNKLMSMLEERVPDLILLDINMPGKNGYECLKEIREKAYSCKIIAQTAYAMENEKERCLNSGCHAYVSKPIDPETLYQEILRVFNK